MVYNSYTSKDEKHLVQYLAENNRDGKGRHGNNIYKQLVHNGKKWPWSKNHTWQSWRDHFVKNDTKLNKKIRIYQREHGISTEARDSEDEDNKATEIDQADTGCRLAQEEEELSGSSVEKESVCSRKRVRETERGPSAGSRKRQKVIKEKRPSLPKKYNNTSLATDHVLAETGKAKPIHPDIEDNEDHREVNKVLAPNKQTNSTGTFDKLPVGRAVLSNPRRFSAAARKVPVPTLSDDSFDSLFDADSDVLVPDSDEALLPGKAQYRDQRDDFFQTFSGVSTPSGPVDKRRSLPRKRNPPVLSEGPFKTTLTWKAAQPGRIRQDANLESDAAVSPWPPVRSKPQTPGSPRDRKRQAGKRGQVKYDSSDGQAAMHYASGIDVDHWQENNRSQIASDTNPIYTPQHQLKDVKLERGLTIESVASQIPIERGVCDDSGFCNDQGSPSTQRQRVDHPEQGTSGVSRAVSQTSQHGRYIDLHEEGKRLHVPRTGDVLDSSRGTSASSVFSKPHSHHSPISIQLSTQDQSLVTTLGIQQAVSMMSKNHGFTEEVVSRILQNVSSIPRADEILREMRMKAEEAALNRLMDEPSVRRTSKQKYAPSKASRKLEISVMSDDEMSDYSPPSKTRAGQFSRLVEQGRHEEAYAREARRASGVGYVPNNSNVENVTWSLSTKPGSRAEPKAVEDGIFLDNHAEEIDADTADDAAKDIADLRDAHATMAPTFEQQESNLTPQRALQRFQQTARIVKQILIDHQGHS